MADAADLDIRRKRLIYRSEHTGTQETDLLLGQFARAHVPGFDAVEVAELERLLDASDPDLWLWLTGRADPPPALDGPVLRRLRAHRYRPADR
ncbi:MAG: succinate dehydrogenase assembly factor 2 [Alphaproteobacteria bacterium]